MDFGAAFEKMGNAQAEQACKDGHAAIAASDYPRAVLCFQRCVQIEPSKVYLLALAQAHETNGQPEEAVAQYHATLGVDPNFYGALQGLTRLGVAPLRPPPSSDFDRLSGTDKAEMLSLKGRGVSDETIRSLYGCTVPASALPRTKASASAALPAAGSAAAAAQLIQAEAAARLSLGGAVRIAGLQAQPALNGQYGLVVGLQLPSGRFPVRLHGGDKVVQIKPANCESVNKGRAGVPAFEDIRPHAAEVVQGGGSGGGGGGGAAVLIGDLFTASQPDYLRAQGVTHVLNCAGEADGAGAGAGGAGGAGSAGACGGSGSIFAGTGITVLNLPIQDRCAEDIEAKWETGLAFLRQAGTADELSQRDGASQASCSAPARVFVHCVQGKSRSAALVLAHLMACRGLALEVAFSLLKRVRPTAMPNLSFWLSLLQLEQQLGLQSLQQSAAPAPAFIPQPKAEAAARRALEAANKAKVALFDAHKGRFLFK
jgi:protein-tyrosine phosphatase